MISTGGQLGVALEQRVVRGLESGGLDLTGPTSAPATEQVVTGVRIANASAVAAASAATGYADLQPVLRLLAPGRGRGRAHHHHRDDRSGNRVLTRIDGGKVTDITLPGLTDGTYSLDVRSSRPVVAGARVATVTDVGPPPRTPARRPAGTTTNTAGTDGSVAGGTSHRHRHAGSSAARNDECLERHERAATTATARGSTSPGSPRGIRSAAAPRWRSRAGPERRSPSPTRRTARCSAASPA